MKHARSDYDRIQDPSGIIPQGEPVFLIRGKDKAAPQTLRCWADIAKSHGADDDIVRSAYRQAAEMEEWQKVHGSQIPDAPEGSIREEKNESYQVVGVDLRHPGGDKTVTTTAHLEDGKLRVDSIEASEQPEWEPGMVVMNPYKVKRRLDVLILVNYRGDQRWQYTSMGNGYEGVEDMDFRNWKIHRLPHEFKVGDWFECDCVDSDHKKPLRVDRIELGILWCGEWGHIAGACRHVPAPKEVMRNEQAHKLEQGAVTGAHRAVETSENPFTGPHWFSEANRERCESPEGFNHKLQAWSTSDWITALVGELGEAANNAKKLNRIRDGIPGNKEKGNELQDKLRKELGDTYVYLDLLCQSLGFYALDAAIDVFDEKSRDIGYRRKLRDELNRIAGRGK